MISLLLRSFLIGVAVAMPVGPIGVVCIDHSLRGGIRMGVAAGAGAALADAIFGFISGLGSSAFLASLGEIWHFRLVAALFIFYLGIRSLLRDPSQTETLIQKGQAHRATLTTFFLTISNPITILSFAGIFVGLGIVIEDAPLTTATILSLGIFIGSTVWWFFLSFVANSIQKKANFKLTFLSKVSGSLMILFGALILLTLI